MAMFEVEEKVARADDGLFGIVREVEEPFLFGEPSYLVKFYDGSSAWVRESELHPA